jgi:hypothetical protein
MSILRAIWMWFQTNSSGVSVILSLSGFAIVLLQLRKTRHAAEASRVASDKALRAISEIDTISDLASLKERLKVLQVSIRGSRYEVAYHEAQSLREGFHQLRSRKGFESDESRIHLQAIVTFLSKLQDNLERKIDDSTYQLPLRAISAKLSEHATELSGWMEKKRFELGGKTDV